MGFLTVKGVGDGMWDEEDEPSNDNPTRPSKRSILIWEQREVHFLCFTLCLLPAGLTLFVICAFVNPRLLLFGNVATSALELFLSPSFLYVRLQMTMHACE